MDNQEILLPQEQERPPESVLKFVKENVIDVAEGRKCIDGRYNDGQGIGMIARPGGDFGYVMTLLALQNEFDFNTFPIKNAFDLVHTAVAKDGGKFYMHTDEHAGEGHIGCGHASHAAAENTDLLYGVHSVQAKQALKRAAEVTKEDGGTMIWENLKGDHKEEGLLIIKDKDKTLRSQATDGRMFFLYDQARDEAYMREILIPLLAEQMKLDTAATKSFEQEFLRVSTQQMNATLELLAKGKPQFEVEDLVGDDPKVNKVAIKPQLFIDAKNPHQVFEDFAASAAD